MSDRDPSVTEAGIKLGSVVATSLAPQFLALILVTALFLGVLAWFVDARARHTAELLQQLLTVCLKVVPKPGQP